ncbi:MAG TPA: hypothetical protein VI978_02325 [Candidatus Paceibacterota bacterium]
MRYLSHDELHKNIETNPELKKRSDQIHSLPKAKNWEEFLEQKLQMLDIYAQVMECRFSQEAQDRIREIVEHLRQFGESLEDIRESGDFAKYLEFIKSRERVWSEERKCYAPNANSYVCYCN